MDTINDALLAPAAPAEATPQPAQPAQPDRIDLTDIPRPSFAALLLLQKIDSPFTRAPVDENGFPAFDENGQPAPGAIPIIPSLQDVAEALYILLHQHNFDRIERLIETDGGAGFCRSVMQMAASMEMADVHRASLAINTRMSEINTVQKETSIGGPEGNAEPIGPMQ